MKAHPSAQDAFAQLVEESRIGLVNRIILDPRGNLNVHHKPGVDFTDLPVFSLGEFIARADIAAWQAVDAAFTAGAYRLPHERCGVLMRMSPDNPGLTIAPEQHGVPEKYQPDVGRYYLTLVEQDADTHEVFLHGFMRHDTHDHWSANIWQASVTIKSDHDGPGASIEIAYDQDLIRRVSGDFFPTFEKAIFDRVLTVLASLHQIVNHCGTARSEAGTDYTKRLDTRREKLGLAPISRIRVIDFAATVPQPNKASASGTGSPKAPHFRRGTWRDLRSGARVWVKPSKVHGGGRVPPPWYDVVAPPDASRKPKGE